MKTLFVKMSVVLIIIGLLATACAPAAAPTAAPAEVTKEPVVEQPTAAPVEEKPTTEPAQPPAASNVVLRALIRPDEGENIAEYTAAFEKETGIKVMVDFVGWDTIFDKIITTLGSGGGGYDIIFISSSWITSFGAGGWFDSLDDAIPANERGEWLEAILDRYTYDGHLIGYPWYSGGAHMVYNKDVLDKAGVDPASIKTWDDFMAACELVKSTNAADYCFTPSAKFPGEAEYSIGTIMLAFGSEGILDDSGNPILQKDDGALNAFTFLKEGIDKGYFNTAGIDMDDYATLIEFGTGKVAFLLDSTWSVTNANNNKDVSQILGKVGYMMIPGTAETKTGGYIYGGAFGILKTSTHKEEALQYLKFQTSEAAQKDHAIKGANMPTRVALFSDPDIPNQWPGFAILAEQISYGIFPPKVTWWNEFRLSLAAAEQDVMAGRKTPQEAVDWLVSEAERIGASQ